MHLVHEFKYKGDICKIIDGAEDPDYYVIKMSGNGDIIENVHKSELKDSIRIET